MKVIKKLLYFSNKLFFAVIFLMLSFFIFPSVVNAVCDPPCPSGTYECNYGTMCCTGEGCPSYQCSEAGYYPVKEGEHWTCCAPWVSCDPTYLIYSERGTCSYCDTSDPGDVPPGGGETDCLNPGSKGNNYLNGSFQDPTCDENGRISLWGYATRVPNEVLNSCVGTSMKGGLVGSDNTRLSDGRWTIYLNGYPSGTYRFCNWVRNGTSWYQEVGCKNVTCSVPLPVKYAYLQGVIWDDRDGDNAKDANETWMNNPTLTCAYNIHDFHVNYNGSNIRNYSGCNPSGLGYYATSTSIDVGQNKTITLSNLPSGYECDSWLFRKLNSSGDLFDVSSGPGCTASVNITELAGSNNLHWKIKKTNVDPVGALSIIGSKCISSDSIPGDIGKIETSGWACDGSDWTKELNTNFYLDATGPSGFIGSTVASIPAEPAVAAQCGGNANHRFYFKSTGTFSSGTHSLYAFAVDYPLGINSQLTDSPQTVTCNLDYNLSLTAKELPDSYDSNICQSDWESKTIGGVPQAKIEVYDPTKTTDNLIGSGTADASGVYTISKIPLTTNKLSITASKTESGEAPDVYTLLCPNPSPYILSLSFPEDGVHTRTSSLGLVKVYKSGWVTAMDADIFAGSVSVAVPIGTGSQPAGFTKALVNSKDNSTGGFIFSKGEISSPLEISPDGVNHLYEMGGRAKNLESSGIDGVPNVSHESRWLKNYSFAPPKGIDINEITNIASNIEFEVDNIYTISVDNFNEALEIGSINYTIQGDGVSGSGGSGVAILYINQNESDDLNVLISNEITTSSSGRLIIVSPLPVLISSSVGAELLGYDIKDNPNIMAGIVANGDITFESVNTGDDNPIMLTAPLISSGSIHLGRDLGHDGNAVIPAQSVASYNKFLYLLSVLEKNKSEETLYYTGLTSYDLDWEYIY